MKHPFKVAELIIRITLRYQFRRGLRNWFVLQWASSTRDLRFHTHQLAHPQVHRECNDLHLVRCPTYSSTPDHLTKRCVKTLNPQEKRSDLLILWLYVVVVGELKASRREDLRHGVNGCSSGKIRRPIKASSVPLPLPPMTLVSGSERNAIVAWSSPTRRDKRAGNEFGKPST